MSKDLPISSFDILLQKLVVVLELSSSGGELTPQGRQALLQATNDLKDALNQAKSLINALPGGELCLDEQDEVIDMLEHLKGAKKAQLEQLSQYVPSGSASDSPATDAKDVTMEIDSTASTPGA